MLLSTIICIQYLRGWGFGFVCACPCCPCLVSHIVPRRSHHHHPCILMATLHLVTSIILHLPPTNSHGVTSNQQKVLLLCYFLPCRTHNRLIISLISPWVLTPQGSHAHFAVHLVRFSSHVVQNPALCVQNPPPCGIKSPPMWYNLCLHATSRTNPEPIPKEGEAMKSHENKPKNDLERPKIHLNPINFTVFRPKTKFAFFSPIPLSGVFYPKTDFLNSPSGLTPVFFETKANGRGKNEQLSG